VAQLHTIGREFHELEPMGTVKPHWLGESELYGHPWLVGFNHTLYWAMSANGTDAQGTIKAHRRPVVAGPELVIFRCQAIDERSNSV